MRLTFGARLCVSIAAFCPLFTPPLAAITPCLTVDECLPLPLCRDDSRSVSPYACRSGGVLCVRFVTGIAALSMRLTFGARLCVSIAAFCRSSCPAMRFYCGVWPLFTSDIAFLSRCFASAHACCLPHSAKQDGLRYLAFLFRGSRSPFVRSRGVGVVIFLGRFTSGLCAYLWRSRRGCRGHGRCGGRGWRRGLCTSLRGHIGFAVLSAGSTLGLRAPDCAKESSTLWTLFRGWPSGKVRFTRG